MELMLIEKIALLPCDLIKMSRKILIIMFTNNVYLHILFMPIFIFQIFS